MILALAGCNEIYNLDATKARDAGQKEFFDAPTDAPFACPATGVPEFKFALEHVPIMKCHSYVPSRAWGKALTACGSEISQGEIDKSVAKATVDTNTVLFDPRLWPDGDGAFFENHSINMEESFVRNADESWSSAGVIGPVDLYTDYSTPSRGPDRRVIRIRLEPSTGVFTVTELSNRSGTWQPVETYPLTDLKASEAFHPSLTADGLQLVSEGRIMAGDKGVIYTSRPDLDTKFGPFAPLSTVVADGQYPFLEENCGRIYFNTTTTVFAQERL